MRYERIATAFAVCAFLAGPLCATAQQASQSGQTSQTNQTSKSLGEAARKVREQQKQAPKPKMVWNNDNLPTSGSVSVVGQPTAEGNTTAAGVVGESAAPSVTASATDNDEQLARLKADLEAAKKDLDSAKTDLDIAQREYKLDSDQYFSMPNYRADQQGQSKLDAEKKQIDAKQQAVEAAQKKVDELQKQIDALNEKAKAAPKD